MDLLAITLTLRCSYDASLCFYTIQLLVRVRFVYSKSILYSTSIYAIFVACRAVPCPFRRFAYLARAQPGKYRSLFSRSDDSHRHAPDLNPRHVCPPCRSPAHRPIFSCSLRPLISHFSTCARPYVFFLFCCCRPSHPCFLLRICPALRRRYQCVSILPIGTLPFFFSDKTARERSQPTVSCLRRLQRSWRSRRKLRPRANRRPSRSLRAPVFGRYALHFFFA